jgi:hypothetical protein
MHALAMLPTRAGGSRLVRPSYSSSGGPLIARAPRALEGGEGGVADLLQRDRKAIDLERAAEAFGVEEKTAAAPTTTTATTAPPPPTTTPTPLRARSDRQRLAAAAADGARSKTAPTRAAGSKASRRRSAEQQQQQEQQQQEAPAAGPRRCKEAIDQGVAALEAGDPDAAIELFTLALELPGNGAFRLPGRAREYSCPSSREEQAALFNMACAYARKGAAFFDAAVECLEAACDDAGFDDWETLLSDADLQPLGQARLKAVADARRGAGAALAGLVARVRGGVGGGGGGGGDGGGKAEVKITDTRGKPWIMW